MKAAAARLMQFWPACLLVAGLAVGGVALAQPSSGTAWASLTPAQRAALQPLQRDWSRIEPARQQKWLEVANRFPSLPADEQQRMQQRMADWSRLTPEERGKARLNYRQTRQLTPEELQARWQAYQALPADQKRRLAERGEAPPNPARKPERSAAQSSNKSNIVVSPRAAPVRTVAPTLVQARPGATTKLLSKPSTPPLHQQHGLPKIAATPGFVDASTLLPQRGAQGAAARPGTAAAPASAASGPARE